MSTRTKNYKHQEEVSDAIRELSSYNIAKRKIRELKDQREELIEELSSVRAIDYSKVVVQGGQFNDGMTDIITALSSITNRIAEEITKNEERLSMINDRLEQLDLYRGQVLHYYFIEMVDVQQIALRLSWSERTIKRYKYEGLRDYQKLMLAHNVT